jgi:hypothetical protein
MGFVRVLVTACLAMSVAAAQEMPRATGQPMPGQMMGQAMPPGDAADLEKKVAANPDDTASRMELIGIYIRRMNMPMMSTQAEGRKGYLPHLEWVIEHHPEAALPALPGMGILHPEEAERVLGWWEKAMERHPNAPTVVFNAGNFYGTRDVRKGIELLKKSRTLGAPRAAQALGTTYFGVFLAVSRPEEASRMHLVPDAALAGDVRAELERSSDTDVYGTTGGWLVCFDRPAPRADFVAFGKTLVERAQKAEPNNPRWAQAVKCTQR